MLSKKKYYTHSLDPSTLDTSSTIAPTLYPFTILHYLINYNKKFNNILYITDLNKVIIQVRYINKRRNCYKLLYIYFLDYNIIKGKNVFITLNTYNILEASIFFRYTKLLFEDKDIIVPLPPLSLRSLLN
ncbi:hypothetical protein V8E51_013222 [Hyaloscypha variabilis]